MVSVKWEVGTEWDGRWTKKVLRKNVQKRMVSVRWEERKVVPVRREKMGLGCCARTYRRGVHVWDGTGTVEV